MTRFVKSRHGYVNLAHAVRVEATDDPATGDRDYDLIGVDGKVMGRTSCFDEIDAEGVLVPAASGAFVYVCHVVDRGERPKEGDVVADAVPVVAWVVQGRLAEPVLVDQTCDDDRVLVPAPDGKVIEACSCVYASLDAAKRHILAKAQAVWDAA